MRMQSFLPALLVGLALTGLALVPAHVTGETKDKIDTAQVDKLVEQLGSDTFAEREAATAALAKIGMPALGSLRKAITSKDNEVRKRAKDLLTKLEKEVASAEVLTPTKVHLVYKDTPLKEALEDLKKQTGAVIVLHDPDKKLAKTKVTLDTGKTTFWDALEKFCDAAGVVEGDPNTVGAPAERRGPGGPPAIGIVPAPPGVKIRPAPAQPQPAPPARVPVKPIEKKVADPDAPVSSDDEAQKADKDTAEGNAKKKAAEAAAEKAAKAKEDAKAVAQPAIQIQIQIGGGVGIPVAPIGPGGFGMPGRGWMPVQPGQITLMPGKRAKVPTDTTSSIRVRLGDKTKIPAVPNAKEFNLVLEVSPEPRVRWQSLIGITIDKAIDDNDIKLKQVVAKADPNGAPGPGGVLIFIGGAPGGGGMAMPGWGGPGGMWFPGSSNGMHHYVPVKLEKGAKASKSLKELTGTIAAYVQTPAEAMMSIDNLSKAKGKGVKGKNGTGELEVGSYTKNDDGTVTIEFTFTQPENVTPETQVVNPVGMPAMPPMIAPIRIRPAIVPNGAGAAPAQGGAARAVRAVAVAEKVAPQQVAPAPAIAPALPPVILQAPGGVGIAMPGGMAMPMMNYRPFGLTLRDDKDNVLPANIQHDFRKGRGFGAPGTKMSFIAVYRPAKGAVAEPAKLVFTGRKTAAVDIPFTLKNVPLE